VGKDQPRGTIDGAKHEQWGTFNGTFYRRIEFTDLLQRESTQANREKDSETTPLNDAASFLQLIASASLVDETCTCDELEKILETPLE
jgi:hypothetical protein